MVQELTRLSRRSLVLGSAGGLAALSLAGCGGSGGGGGTATTTLGSQWSDPVPKKALAGVLSAYKKTGGAVDLNQFDHESFPQQLNNYLQGRPDDTFTWCAGYRTQFFAQQGLLTPIDDVWDDIGDNFSPALEKQSLGLDDKHYVVPFYYYPWAMFYRKSVFAERGYAVPTTLDELTSLCDTMTADGLSPIAFGDKDGWPAMGTFDILNMRVNGYDFHASLMRGDEAWDGSEVRAVFDTWADLLPYHQEASLGRTWQEAAQSLGDGTSGMYFLGLFVGQQFTGADLDDLDFFAFPEIDSAIGADAIDAPIDGFLLSKRPKDAGAAKDFLRFLGTAEAQDTYLGLDPSNIAAAADADTSGYTALQKKAADLVAASQSVAQFMDRDTRPDFASTVMLPSIQEFIQDPGSISSILTSVEEQKQSIFQ